MRRRFVRHPRGDAGDRPVGLRNNDQFSITVGILPGNEHGLAAPGMERIVNPPLDRVLAGSMSLLRAATGCPASRQCLARSPRSALTQRRRLRFVIPDQVLDRRLRRLPGRLIIKSRFAPRRAIMARTPISHPRAMDTLPPFSRHLANDDEGH
jgi:hypothetical protein